MAVNIHKTLSDIERDVRDYYDNERPYRQPLSFHEQTAAVAVSVLCRAAVLLEETGDTEQRAFAREVKARIPAMLRGERSLT